ncbi:Pycsar system effector family protein [Microbispora rosea]|uniref:Pycsar system effector family protein n=1 Tax=Microbispora rosea TaxID=58117 RepID=UPI0037ADE6EB
MTDTAPTRGHGCLHGPDVLDVLRAEADAARAELARVDSKAAALIGWAGTGFAVISAAATITTLPIAATAVVVGGAALLAAAVAVLLTVIRPSIPRRDGTGFVRIAALRDGEQLQELVSVDLVEQRRQAAAHVVRLSQIALAKYRRLRAAVDLLLVALVVLAAALPLGVLA